METDTQKMLCAHLEEFISENKRLLIRKAIEHRTQYLTLVLEDIYQPQNASAVIRTCDCLGIQRLHIVEQTNPYRINPQVTLGSNKWVEVVKHGKETNISQVLQNLKQKGYSLVATTPHKEGYLPEELPLNNRIALIFGKELLGLTDTAIGLADHTVRIPMYGFTESYNISVSAGIILYTLINRIRNSEYDWKMTETEATETMLFWLRNIIKRPSLIEKAFLEKKFSDFKR